MEGCIAGLYQSLGMSVGAEFSPEDVSLLYQKVFHIPSGIDETHAAMKKIAGDDNSWSCFGENVFDVLLEIDREKEKKEKLYWDLQLLNVGNLNTLMDQPVIIDPRVLNCLHQSTEPNTFKSVVRGKELNGSVRGVKRLKKAARQCWARLASESVGSILPSPWQGPSLELRGQAWGYVSLSDVLLLLEVKYDVVTHLLYTEMLQEHHTLSIWETLLPWQQHKEEEGLGDLAEEALESGDMLGLAELPGAFRIYRACQRSRPESREQSWSAISLLYELGKFRQQEMDALTVLGERLDRQNLRLLCLYISLATLRAQREKTSYSALLAARQSWGKCRTKTLALLQQRLLQLLVLSQEQERKQLVKLAKGVSIEDLQEPGCTVPPKEDSRLQASLRNGCIKRLRQIHAGLQTRNDRQTLQLQSQLHTASKPTMWYQHQLEDCSLLLLANLMELQEFQASAVLSALMDKSAQHVRALRDDFESDLQAQRFTNLLQLISDAPLTSDSLLTPCINVTGNSSNEGITGVVCDQNSSGGPAEAQTGDSMRRASGELNATQAAEWTDEQDNCTGCGAIVEDLPYLEILCVSGATSTTLSADREAQEGEEVVSATKSPQSYEKQGSLIACAWSKPPEDDTDDEAAAAVGQSQDVQSSDYSSTAEHTQCGETSGESDREEMKPTLFHSDSTGRPDTQSADEQCSPEGQPTVDERAIADQSESDLQTYALVAETLQAAQPHLLVKQHAGDFCSELTDGTANVDSEVLQVEMCPTATELWDPIGPEPARAEEQKYNSPAAIDCSPAEREAIRESTLMERERAREPVSAMERERTMRNLVDMQRKVEQRQQRDRETQLLRVQERLSIIQNRKAEEDLLGLKHSDRLRHLTQDLPQEDKSQQKTVVRERLDQLRRERSNVMQSKRDRNTAVFKELLGPVALHSRETNDAAD